MKNIGIISHNFPYTLKDRRNAGIFVSDIAQELAKSNNVFVFIPKEGNRGNKIGKVKIINFPVISGSKLGYFKIWNPFDVFRFFSFFMGGIFSLPRFIKENKISMNLVMWSFPSGVFAYIAKKIYGIPYITWCLGSDIYVYARMPLLKGVIRCILRNSNFVFADGIDLVREVKKLSSRKCVFIPSASKAKFKNNKVARKNGLINLVFVGRMEKVKGPDVFLDALGLIKNSLYKFKIHFIGDGLLLDKLKQKVTEIGIAKQTIFYGNVNDFQKISDVIRNADWLVIPSRSDSIPLVFSEAMKCSTPIIASDLPDLTYLVNNYKVGLLFKKGNFKELASIIMKLPKLKVERRKFSANALKSSKDFSIEESSRQIMSYLKII